MKKKGSLNVKSLLVTFLILIGVFFILNFVGVFSINSLPILVKESEPIRKPFAILFIGIILLAFVIVCFIHRRNQKR